jgi:cytoskeletal protein CcmA (bactofilin family)
VFGRGDRDAKAPTPPSGKKGDIQTVIGPNVYLRGALQADGGARVDGIFEGTIDLTGNLIVGEGAKVVADIKANSISISGAVKGDIDGNRVEILDNGRVWGNLKVGSLLLNEGAYLRGQTTMRGDLEPPMIEPPKGLAEEPGEETDTSGATIVDVEPKARKQAETDE